MGEGIASYPKADTCPSRACKPTYASNFTPDFKKAPAIGASVTTGASVEQSEMASRVPPQNYNTAIGEVRKEGSKTGLMRT